MVIKAWNAACAVKGGASRFDPQRRVSCCIGVSTGRRFDKEKEIRGVTVKGSQMIDTKHGFKIKTGHTVIPMEISDVTVDGTNVENPISIDQMLRSILLASTYLLVLKERHILIYIRSNSKAWRVVFFSRVN
ncbi:hypothetical protein QQ045_023702 [Rhodiola kirilowii]